MELFLLIIILINSFIILVKIDDISIDFTVKVDKEQIKKELLKELKEKNEEEK